MSRILLSRTLSRTLVRTFTEGDQSSTGPTPTHSVNTNVPGLSSAVINPAVQPVGPGVDPNKSGAYKVPEYFCYNSVSFFEAEVEMAKYRLPQPSALKK